MGSALQWRRQAYAVLLMLCVMSGGARAQSQAEPDGKGAKSETSDPKRAKLITDTRRLLALSREVQAEMAKNGPNTLSLGTVKKLEELQKLAATVKAETVKLP